MIQRVIGQEVLVVDDDAAIRQMLASLLELEGYQVTQARDGIEALIAFSDNRPDIVILDIRMPRLAGIDVLKCLREMNGDHDQVPVIVLSAYDDHDTMEQSYSEGAAVYMTKPANVGEMMAVVDGLSSRGPNAG